MMLQIFLMVVAVVGLALCDDNNCFSIPKDTELFKIACMGDSMTFGDGLHVLDLDEQTPYEQGRGNYPMLLEGILKQKISSVSVRVENFSKGGTTVVKHSRWSFQKTAEPSFAKEFAPHLILLMLGTNDSKSYLWNKSSHLFVPHLTELIALLSQLSEGKEEEHQGRPDVWLLLPPPCIENKFNIQCNVLQNEIIPKIQSVASSLHLNIVDVNGPFLRTNVSELLQDDGVHTNEKGAKLIAETIASVLSKCFP